MDHIILSTEKEPEEEIQLKIDQFFEEFEPVDLRLDSKVILQYDKKSKSYYICCHLKGDGIVKNADLEATIEEGDEEDSLYKLNREITENKPAYQIMERDAKEGRSFEDIVLEYDDQYRPETPLKVYGGQHRIRAITKALENDVDESHGVRIYFGLNKDQKVEIATVNNTSIAVSNDLLDRMQEQLIGTELRNWCQNVGLLGSDQDFADKRNPDIPTVRIARTLIVNYHNALDVDTDVFHQPTVCSSGGIDEQYQEIRSKVEWNNEDFLKMGREFAKLHKIQSKKVKEREKDSYAEYARKTFSLSVVSSWSYAAGLFQRNKEKLKHLYKLTDDLKSSEDPLNGVALSKARLKGVDPDTYRGLGTRYSASELGRMLEVFLILVAKKKKRITKKLANAAISSYVAKKSKYEADKALDNL